MISNMKVAGGAAVLSLLSLTSQGNAQEGRISTDQIVTSALECTDCVDWRLSGLCVWLKCGLSGCSIKTSIRVSHNNPDLVVTSYSNDSPWTEWKTVKQGLTGSLLSVRGATSRPSAWDSLRFKNCEAVGHPALIVFNKFLAETFPVFCPSAADYLTPYFDSGLDFIGWNLGIPDMFSAEALSGQPRVSNWAPVYPRMGFVHQPDDPKAAAVTAVRAADIVTQEGQPHVYQAIPESCSQGNMKCWAPPAGIDATRWQMLVPLAQQNLEKLDEQPADWSNNRYDGTEQYAWTLWRRYSCCQRKGAFLGVVGF